jgi:hypothetical protein
MMTLYSSELMKDHPNMTVSPGKAAKIREAPLSLL